MRNTTPNATVSPDLGLLKGVYHVKMSFRYVGPVLLLIAFVTIAIFVVISSTTVFQWIASSIFTLVFLVPISYVTWNFIAGLRDELTVYTGGFTYKSRKGIQHCTWKQISKADGVFDLDERIKITSFAKNNGEKIVFAY